MRWLVKFIYFKLLGWQVTGFTDVNSIKKAVIIGAPHTHSFREVQGTAEGHLRQEDPARGLQHVPACADPD